MDEEKMSGSRPKLSTTPGEKNRFKRTNNRKGGRKGETLRSARNETEERTYDDESSQKRFTKTSSGRGHHKRGFKAGLSRDVNRNYIPNKVDPTSKEEQVKVKGWKDHAGVKDTHVHTSVPDVFESCQSPVMESSLCLDDSFDDGPRQASSEKQLNCTGSKSENFLTPSSACVMQDEKRDINQSPEGKPVPETDGAWTSGGGETPVCFAETVDGAIDETCLPLPGEDLSKAPQGTDTQTSCDVSGNAKNTLRMQARALATAIIAEGQRRVALERIGDGGEQSLGEKVDCLENDASTAGPPEHEQCQTIPPSESCSDDSFLEAELQDIDDQESALEVDAYSSDASFHSLNDSDLLPFELQSTGISGSNRDLPMLVSPNSSCSSDDSFQTPNRTLSGNRVDALEDIVGVDLSLSEEEVSEVEKTPRDHCQEDKADCGSASPCSVTFSDVTSTSGLGSECSENSELQAILQPAERSNPDTDTDLDFPVEEESKEKPKPEPSKLAVVKKKFRRRQKRPVTFQESYILMDESLGTGTSSSVFGCKHRKTNETFAVKVMEKTEFVNRQRVFNEIEILHLCREERHIVNLHAFFEDDVKFYLIYERLYGGPLLSRIQSEEHFNESEASKVICDVAKALRTLHARGIAHRDLKPSNILCMYEDQISPVKVCDFDLASRVSTLGFETDSPATTPALETPVGSAEYMAPEVVDLFLDEASFYDKKCDLWSLGVIMYIMLCGRPPFAGKCGQACGWDQGKACRRCQESLFKSIQYDEVIFPEKEWESISEDAKDLIMHLLVKDPERRISAEMVLAHPWIESANLDTPLHTPKALSRSNSTVEDLHSITSEITFNNRLISRAHSETSLPNEEQFQSYSSMGPVQYELPYDQGFVMGEEHMMYAPMYPGQPFAPYYYDPSQQRYHGQGYYPVGYSTNNGYEILQYGLQGGRGNNMLDYSSRSMPQSPPPNPWTVQQNAWQGRGQNYQRGGQRYRQGNRGRRENYRGQNWERPSVLWPPGTPKPKSLDHLMPNSAVDSRTDTKTETKSPGRDQRRTSSQKEKPDAQRMPQNNNQDKRDAKQRDRTGFTQPAELGPPSKSQLAQRRQRNYKT